MGLSFFGLTLKDASISRIKLFTEIHEIVFHGKGGYDWDTIYNMPCWLRLFTLNKINNFYEKQAESNSNNNPNTTNLMDSNGKINPSLKNLPKPPNLPKSIPPSKRITYR